MNPRAGVGLSLRNLTSQTTGKGDLKDQSPCLSTGDHPQTEKSLIKLANSPSHSILSPGRPALALTQKHKASGEVSHQSTSFSSQGTILWYPALTMDAPPPSCGSSVGRTVTKEQETDGKLAEYNSVTETPTADSYRGCRKIKQYKNPNSRKLLQLQVES